MAICQCGCEKECKRTYVQGHNRRGIPRSKETIEKLRKTLLEPTFNAKWRKSIKNGWTKEVREKKSQQEKGKILSEEHRKKIGEANKGKKRTGDERERARKQLYALRINLSKRIIPTKIETILYNFLESENICYERQKSIGGGYIVDAYIPKNNLIIEADGKYWHSTVRGIETDKRKNEYIFNNRYNLIRLGEDEIKNGNFINKLKEKQSGAVGLFSKKKGKRIN